MTDYRKVCIILIIVSMLILFLNNPLFACEITEIKFYAGATADIAENGELTTADVGSPFYVYLTWEASSSGDFEYDIAISVNQNYWQNLMVEETSGSSGEELELMPSGSITGLIYVGARMRRKISGQGAEDGWTEREICTVTIVGVDSISVDKTCIPLDPSIKITYTANPNPSNHDLLSMRWQYCFRTNKNNLWSDWFSTNGEDEKCEHSLYTYAWFKHRARNGDAANWVESPEVSIVGVQKILYQVDGTWVGTERDVGEATPCVKKGGSISFKAQIRPLDADWPAGKPVWDGHDDLGEETDGSEVVTLIFDTVGTYTISAECGNTKEIEVVCQEVVFVEDTGMSYGFDDWTDPVNPYKSVNNGGSDTAKAEIARSPVSSVYFKSLTTDKATVSPSQAANSSQTVTITGVDKGDSNIEARANSVNGDTLAGMTAAVYDQVSKTVCVIPVKLPGQTLSLPFTAQQLENKLNDIFSQCVVGFSVDIKPSTIIDYDDDADGKLYYDDDTEHSQISSEALVPGYDFTIFVVGGIKSDLGTYDGFTSQNVTYCFISQTGNNILYNIPHEIGHMLGLGGHVEVAGIDDENLMFYSNAYGGEKLRKGQWDSCNPRD